MTIDDAHTFNNDLLINSTHLSYFDQHQHLEIVKRILIKILFEIFQNIKFSSINWSHSVRCNGLENAIKTEYGLQHLQYKIVSLF